MPVMTIPQLIAAIHHHVKTLGDYVPREHQTIGGMWTVDTWRLDDVSVTVEDEGYTSSIIGPEIKVSHTYLKEPIFHKGDLMGLVQVTNKLSMEL